MHACRSTLEDPTGSHSDVEQMLGKTGGAAAVAVDLSGVHLADLTGGQSLARVVAQMTERGSAVRLHGARPAIRPVLEAAGLGKLLDADEPDEPRPSPAPQAQGTSPGLAARRAGLPSRLQPSLE